VFLVVSCPCALVISIPLGFFGGIGRASRQGVLVKGGNYLDAMASLNTVVFDKTGTLTKGVFEVSKVTPAEGFSEGDVLSLAAKADQFSNHPIAKASKNKNREPRELHDQDKGISDYREIAGKGVSVIDENGVAILAGNAKLMEESGVSFTPSGTAGTAVYIAAGGKYSGCVEIADEMKEGAAEAVAALKARGVRKTVMLSGDTQPLADAVADAAGIDEARGGLLPDGKVAALETIMASAQGKGVTAFVGDGINDAPALTRADVGIAMGGLGQDAAIEAADVVIMTDEPGKIADAIDTARFTKRVVWQNISLALWIKGLVLAAAALGFASMWAAVFADVGVALLAVLNSARIIRAR
jgi:Cd2+/Zn2+-exporting ATPase